MIKARWQQAHLNPQQGFTLIELVVVISIAGILAAMAVPAFNTTIMNSAQRTAGNELLRAMYAARSAAVSLSRPVIVCPSLGVSTGCIQDAPEDSWGEGVLVFADDGDQLVGADEVVIQYSDGYASGIDAIKGNKGNFIFRPMNAQGLDNGSLRICDRRGVEHSRALIISRSGKAHIAKYGEADFPGGGC